MPALAFAGNGQGEREMVCAIGSRSSEESGMRATKKADPAGRSTRAAQALPGALGRGVHIRSQHELIKGTDSRYRSALRLMQRGGEAADAYPLLVAAAEDGDGLSMYAIGTWRLHGFHLKKNLREAVRLLRLAADADVAYACFDLGVCYWKGEGVKQNWSKAAKYYLRAFLLGDRDAAEALETIFYWYGGEINLRAIAREFVRPVQAMERS